MWPAIEYAAVGAANDSRTLRVPPRGGSRKRLKSRRDNEPHTGHETIPVIEERPVLLTKPVRTSTVRIDKIVREHEASIEAVLRSDEVVVERRSVDPPQPVDAPPPVRHEGDVTIIPILEERLVVEKRLFVREELRVRRVERSRVSRQRVTVRSEDVRVEREPMSQRAAEGVFDAIKGESDGQNAGSCIRFEGRGGSGAGRASRFGNQRGPHHDAYRDRRSGPAPRLTSSRTTRASSGGSSSA